MRLEPIHDPDGDRIIEQERMERELERADSPQTHLDLGRTLHLLEVLADALAAPGGDRK